MNESTPLRLRAGGSIVLPADSTDQDIDNAGRAEPETEPTQPEESAAKPNTEEQS